MAEPEAPGCRTVTKLQTALDDAVNMPSLILPARETIALRAQLRVQRGVIQLAKDVCHTPL
jgi:hypothetical protein